MKILVIRRDNIGDLICTTPLIRSLRQHFPTARIDALVNSYNVAVVAHNPDLNHVYAYTKAKHRGEGETVAGVYWRRLCLLIRLRFTGYDYAILAQRGYSHRPLRLAKWLAPRHIIGFSPSTGTADTAVDCLLTDERATHSHEVAGLQQLLRPLGIQTIPPSLVLHPPPPERANARAKLLAQSWYAPQRLTIGIHISARKVSQRWPIAHFITLLEELHTLFACQFVLFWSPGAEDNPLHPGDDAKAASILAACRELPMLPYATQQLSELIGAMSLCDALFCSDGGAMHVGAGLGLPIVCLFGQSDAAAWHPWGVAHQVLQAPSKRVEDISPEQALAACRLLFHGISPQALLVESSSQLSPNQQ